MMTEYPQNKPAADGHLLDMLVCPTTNVPLQYNASTQELICPQTGLAYPIRDGIPILIKEQARRLDPYGK